MQYLYLIINILALAGPLFFSFGGKLQFASRWKAILPAILFPAMFFLLHDELFTQAGYWGFNAAYISGIKCFSLPVEEILFFVCIPYACLFVHAVCAHYLKQRPPYATLAKWISCMLIVLFGVVALAHTSRPYTFWCFGLAALALCFVQFVLQPAWLQVFYISFSLCVLPFLLVNGLLTGAFIPGEVVWYNPEAITSWRVHTIPVEDFVYAFFMLLLNTTIFRFCSR